MEYCVWKLEVTAGDGVLGRARWTGLGEKGGVRLRLTDNPGVDNGNNTRITLFHPSIGTMGLWFLYLGGQAGEKFETVPIVQKWVAGRVADGDLVYRPLDLPSR